MNFRSKAGYRRWLAYGHSKRQGNIMGRTPGNTPVKIRGHAIKVHHSILRKAKRKRR